MPNRSTKEIRERFSKKIDDKLKAIRAKPEIQQRIQEIERSVWAVYEDLRDSFPERVDTIAETLKSEEAYAFCTEQGLNINLFADTRGYPVVSVSLSFEGMVDLYEVRAFWPPELLDEGWEGWSREWHHVEYRLDAPLQTLVEEFTEHVRTKKDLADHFRDKEIFFWHTKGRHAKPGTAGRNLTDLFIERFRNPPGNRPRGAGVGKKGRNAELYIRRARGEKASDLAKEYSLTPDAVRKAIHQFYKEAGLPSPTTLSSELSGDGRKCRQCDGGICADCPIGKELKAIYGSQGWQENMNRLAVGDIGDQGFGEDA